MRAQGGKSRRWKLALAVAAGAPAWAALAAAVVLAGPGCGRKTEPAMKEMPTATEAEPAVPEGDYRAEALDGLAESLEAQASVLPGRNADDHRRRLHAIFVEVVQVLPILEGPEPSSSFRQQLRTVETARDRLNPEAGDLTAVEPTIEAGLRATYAALNAMGRDEPYAGQRMSELLSQLGGKLDELDSVRSVGRPYVTADAVQLVAAGVRQMADRVAGRVADAPSTAPSDEPLTPPGAIDAPRGIPTTVPTEEAPTEAPPATETDAAPADDAPSEEMPADDAPADEAPADDAPADEPETEEKLADEKSSDEPADEMPAEASPDAEVSPAETEPPTGDSPEVAEPPADGDAPATGDAETDAAPADEAPAEAATDAPADNVPPAGDEPAADAAAADEKPAADDAAAPQAPAEDGAGANEDLNK